MTAEEFIENNEGYAMEILPHTETPEIIYAAMIEFAEYHVRKALQEAADRAEINEYDVHEQYSPHIDEDSILNCYKDKIK